MNLALILGTFQNAAVLAVLLTIHHFAMRGWQHNGTSLGKATNGLILGAFCIVLNLSGAGHEPSLYLDTRSVLIGLTGLFYSPLTTVVTMAVAVVHRLQIGGIGILPGLLAILTAGSLGMALRHWLSSSLPTLTWTRLYAIGILVHVVLLAGVLVLPLDQALPALALIGGPVLLIFPPVFASIGTLLIRLRQYEAKLEQSRLLTEHLDLATAIGGIGMVDMDAKSGKLAANIEMEKQLGYGDGSHIDTASDLLRRVHPDDRARVRQEHEHFLANSTPDQHTDMQLEFRTMHRQGHWIWVRYLSRVVRWDSQGRPELVAAAHSIIDAERSLEQTRHKLEEESRKLLTEAGESRRALLSALEDRELTERRLRESQRLLGEMSRLARVSGWEVDLDSGQVLVTGDSHHVVSNLNDRCELTFRMGASEVLPEDQQHMARLIKECLASECGALNTELRFAGADGVVTWARALGKVVWENGRATKLRGTLQDITELKHAEEERRRGYELLNKLAAQVPGCIFQFMLSPEGKPCYPWVSAGVQDIYELSPEQAMADGSQLTLRLHPDDREYVVKQLKQSAAALKHLHIEFRTVLPRQGLRWRQCDAMPERLADGGTLWHGMISDITAKKEADQLIWHQANFDALTALPNRRMFDDRLHQEMKKSLRNNLPLALLFLDLDHFKEVNDTLGHKAGDQLLIEVAARLGACVRDTDTVARLGGDEFVVILSELNDQAIIERIAGRILEELDKAITIGGETVYIGASIGITLYPDDADNAEDLLKNGDQAMYAAKREGRHQFQYFTPTMQEASHHRMFIAGDLRQALRRNELWVAYQPIIDLATGRITKAEALIRWQHPQKGLIGPGEFIPVAEDTGLIIDLGDFVMGQVARQLATWREQLDPEFQVSINLSPAQLCASRGSVFELWSAHMASTGLPGAAVIMEITEGLLLDGRPRVREQLQALGNAGIAVAIDDFGTGYSSLSYLNRFHVDYLKIDRSFITQLAPDSGDLALCEAIIAMAHKLGIQVVAEGVETEHQRDMLRAAGCDFAQGYLFSPPVAASKFEMLPGLRARLGHRGLGLARVPRGQR